MSFAPITTLSSPNSFGFIVIDGSINVVTMGVIPVARLLDPTSASGGRIAYPGNVRVLINNIPVSRQFDITVAPIHPPSPIIATLSPRVWV